MDEYDFEQTTVRKNRKRLGRRAKSRDESLLDREAPFQPCRRKRRTRQHHADARCL